MHSQIRLAMGRNRATTRCIEGKRGYIDMDKDKSMHRSYEYMGDAHDNN